MTESANTELALPVINPEQYPALYVTGGLDPYYQQIREQVMSEVPDVNSKKGIDRIKSLASSSRSQRRFAAAMSVWRGLRHGLVNS